MPISSPAATPKRGGTEIENPNQRYWDLGLKCFNQGDYATTAMQTIWNEMLPPGPLPLLATIVGTLYGDTYWKRTKFSVDTLASDLQAALGINPDDCRKAATIAFQKWYGLMVRANMSDDGNIPRSDPITASPDVVLNGKAPTTVQQLIRLWNQYIYTPDPGLKNYTYGRAQSVNTQVPITKPVLRMYASDAGFNPPPSTWIKLYTSDNKEVTPLEGLTSGPIGVGERAANPDAFMFTPQGSGHYCLITLAGSEFFTNNPSDITGNWNSQEWMYYNGAAGWHNVDVPSGNEATFKYYNQDGVPERFFFEAHCRNLPIGTLVSLVSEHKNLLYTLEAQEEITRPYQVIGTQAELPPHFIGDLKVRFRIPQDEPLPPNASIDIRMDWDIPSSHRYYVQAIEQLRDLHSYALRRPVRIPMGNCILVGESE